MQLEQLGLIGNCQCAALVDATGAIVWSCLPRFDSDPVFGGLLDPDGGRFDVGTPDRQAGTQRYLDNTNVLETVLEAPGGRFRVLDFAPRFELHGRMFRPTQFVRLLEPIEGSPRVSVRCDPVLGWSKARPAVTQGSHHVAFDGYASPLRLTTDLPLSHLDGRPFSLTERRRMVLAWGAPIEEPLAPLCDRLLSETVNHWRRWVKQCDIPPRFQTEVIRSALALKLHCFEDTGAIVASVTTSIPESPKSGRTWDYRYCWLRDAYYVVDAFRLLGHFDEREQFLTYVLDVAGGSPDLRLAPLYGVSGARAPLEQPAPAWAGFNGDGPVRVGNDAAAQEQHDIFGEIILMLSPIFHDDRFSAERTPATLDLLLRLADRAISVAGTPDRGIWELRRQAGLQTFSTMMCWAAADRAAAVADKVGLPRAAGLRQAATHLRDEIARRAWSPVRRAYVGTYDGTDLDASLLQMAPLRIFPRDDERLRLTVDAIWQGLSQNGWLMRYRGDDGLGRPSVAFVLCTFWLIEALVLVGRHTEARALMDATRKLRSPLGLIAEDYDTTAQLMCGNFPQAYSHVGLIRAAFAASPRWLDVL
ncbi:MAG: glycoside hydrolase family 15 protein [Vicinamibacterales bacterium]